MRNALRTWSPSTRSSSDIRITPSSHAYSTSNVDAITRKFCPVLFTNRPCISAKVTVVVAMMIAGRFLRYSGVSKRLGSSRRKNSWLSRMATSTNTPMAMNVPRIHWLLQSEFSLA